jgi:hypothetical protein
MVHKRTSHHAQTTTSAILRYRLQNFHETSPCQKSCREHLSVLVCGILHSVTSSRPFTAGRQRSLRWPTSPSATAAPQVETLVGRQLRDAGTPPKRGCPESRTFMIHQLYFQSDTQVPCLAGSQVDILGERFSKTNARSATHSDVGTRD